MSAVSTERHVVSQAPAVSTPQTKRQRRLRWTWRRSLRFPLWLTALVSPALLWTPLTDVWTSPRLQTQLLLVPIAVMLALPVWWWAAATRAARQAIWPLLLAMLVTLATEIYAERVLLAEVTPRNLILLCAVPLVSLLLGFVTYAVLALMRRIIVG